MKYLLIIALCFLAVLWPAQAAQEPQFNNDVRSVSSGLTGVRKNDHLIQALLKVQLKCLDEISAQRRAGKMQTPLNALVRYEVASPLTPEDAMGIKYAILEAAYFGYRQGVRRMEDR
jgi:hypothetical protein